MANPSQPGPVDSLLDRLLGDDTGVGLRVRRGLDESVRRDLENLLNTRWRCLSWPPGLDELEKSLVNYGIPDFSGASFGDPVSQRDLRKILEQCIQRFEPRLRDVRVSLPERGNRQDRTLRFTIQAELRSGTLTRSVAYETALDPTTSSFHVGHPGR
jgi:type VI secretion system protein ImpF